MRNNSNQNKREKKNPYIRRRYIRITSEIPRAAGAAAMAGDGSGLPAFLGSGTATP